MEDRSTLKLTELLVCPECRSRLETAASDGRCTEKPVDGMHTELICPNCNVAYAIEDGIPVMLPDKARRLS